MYVFMDASLKHMYMCVFVCYRVYLCMYIHFLGQSFVQASWEQKKRRKNEMLLLFFFCTNVCMFCCIFVVSSSCNCRLKQCCVVHTQTHCLPMCVCVCVCEIDKNLLPRIWTLKNKRIQLYKTEQVLCTCVFNF